MEPLDMVTVYKVTDPNHADIIKVALEEEGILCQLGGEHQAGFTGLWEIDILVRGVDATRAREIIDSHDQHEKHDKQQS